MVQGEGYSLEVRLHLILQRTNLFQKMDQMFGSRIQNSFFHFLTFPIRPRVQRFCKRTSKAAVSGQRLKHWLGDMFSHMDASWDLTSHLLFLEVWSIMIHPSCRTRNEWGVDAKWHPSLGTAIQAARLGRTIESQAYMKIVLVVHVKLHYRSFFELKMALAPSLKKEGKVKKLVSVVGEYDPFWYDL